MKYSPLIALAALVVSFAPASARADPSSKDADALVLRGVDRFKHQDYESARVAFEQAYGLSPTTALLFNVALAEVQSGHPVEAINHFRQYVGAPDAVPDKVDVIRTKWLPRADSEAGHLHIDVAAGTTILVDGVNVGGAPFDSDVPVLPGEHRIEARRNDVTRTSVVHAIAGAVSAVSFDSVERDGPPVSAAKPVLPTAADRSPRHAPPAEGPSTAKLVTVASLGAAALLAGGMAFVFATSSSDYASRASAMRASLPAQSSTCLGPSAPNLCNDLKDTINKQYSYETLAYVFGGTAAALLLVDAGLLAFWPSSNANRAAVTATPSKGSVMVDFRARF